jgi:hypothetical protein
LGFVLTKVQGTRLKVKEAVFLTLTGIKLRKKAPSPAGEGWVGVRRIKSKRATAFIPPSS